MSAEKFDELSEASFQSETYPSDSDYKWINRKYLEISGVRITPGHMHFDNAYEGKHYAEKMVIQNCGTHLAFVRLCEPNSSTFELKPFPEGKYLSAGMRVIRNVTYTYTAALGVLRGFATISINGEEVDYHFIVTKSASVLSIEPQLLDFGRIDAVNRASTKIFYIKNSGYKGSQFAIDLGRNPLQLIVEPLKGTLPAMSSVPVSVEIVGSKEGEFTEEFWIKSHPPQRVVITGSFISPKLLVRKFISSLDFTLIEFPPTYYGSASTQPLLIKNFSSSHSMYCIMAEIKGTTVPLEDAVKIDDNYLNFRVKPIDGRMAALRGALIQITFAPKITRKKEKSYAACFLKAIRMDCRDVQPTDQIYNEKPTMQSVTAVGSFSTLSTMIKDGGETGTVYDTVYEDEKGSESFSFENAIGVCLHGEKEQAGIYLRPSIIDLTELTLDKIYQRELYVTNKSRRLPIIVKYKKVPAIDVIPQKFELEPEESTEVLVTIRTYKLDRVEKKLVFELFNPDFPPDRKIIRKVGTVGLNIRFEATNVETKVRPEQCVLCKDMPEKLEPELRYRLNEGETAMKIYNDNFYLNYIRSLQKEEGSCGDSWQDYTLTNNKLLHRENTKCKDPAARTKTPQRITSFIPLAPRLLYNIKITPKSIRLRRVAAYTTITDFFEIENLNEFPIRAMTKSSKSCIIFDNNSRFLIDSKQKRKITFTFSTSEIGRYYVNISVLINDATLYEVTAVAHVVPKSLKVESEDIEFTETDGHYKFFKMINSLNAYTSFSWDVPRGCFRIYPEDGGIKAERFMWCMVTYSPNPAEPPGAECVLTSESGHKKVVTISYQKRRHSVVFDSYDIDVGLISLNVPIRRKIILRNLKDFQVLFSVPAEIQVPGITIEPRAGILDGLDSQVFVINIHLLAVVNFDTTIIFDIDGEEEVAIRLRGFVEYPSVSFKPDLIQFRKIAPYSFDTLAFKVKNLCKSEISIAMLEDITEFTITESEDDQYNHCGKIILQPDCTKILFLHFHPVFVSTYSVFVPYVVNGILGPVHIGSANTTNPQHFLKNYSKIYNGLQDVVLKAIPQLLPAVRLNCCAIDKVLEFSSLLHEFVYYGENHYNNVTSGDFEITNVSTESAAVCIRIDDLEFPFSLTPKEETNLQYYEISYRIELAPGEKVTFEANFFPMNLGHYSVKLPIFLRNYYDNKIFNYLILKGVYGLPTMIFSMERCDFEPVPLGVTNEMGLTLEMQNHFEDCELETECNLMGLCVMFENGKKPRMGNSLLNVTISCNFTTTRCFDTVILFQCSCGASCILPITGVTESCLLTSHAFSHLIKGVKNEETQSVASLMIESNKFDTSPSGFIEKSMSSTYSRYSFVHKNTTCFPLFPKSDDESEYGVHMTSLQKTLENWLYSQIFYKKSYYKIPEGFSDFCKVGEVRKKKIFGGLKKAIFIEIPLMQLIMNVAGKEIRNELAPSALPKTDDEKTWFTYVYKTNSNVLYYLRGFSVFLPHVKSKFLLNYDQYLTYEKIKHPDSVPVEESIFYRLSKQCWIDLILQIIKTFFLFRTVQPRIQEPIRESSSDMFKRKDSMSQLSHQSKIEEGGDNQIRIFGPHEQELISWLQNCYELEKDVLWTEPPGPKELVFLDDDLRDGLILGAVTAHYCPYVKPELKDMYTKPQSPEEVHHNACSLVRTWSILRLSYVISPLLIQNNGMVEMLLLANYLYGVLPGYLPREEITIQAPLTQTSFTRIELENLGNDPIVYEYVFFDNENQLFFIGSDSVTIDPGSRKLIRVRYHAKSVQSKTTTLVFSGETPGNKYAKSVAVTLVGVADVSYACMKIPINVDLYRLCQVNIKPISPFKVKANYMIYFGSEPASREENNVLFPWDEVKNLKTVKEFILKDELCEFDEEGRCTTEQLFLCQEIGPRNIWIYFTNPEVGDWGIQLTITGKVTDFCYETIEVILPPNYKHLQCRCRGKVSISKNCPLILRVSIPMKNGPLWTARKTMVLHYVEGDEMTFWSKHIFTPTGTRILKLILNSETHPLRQTVEDTVLYKVQVDTQSIIVTLKKVIIEDVTSEDFFDLPIHPLKNVNLAQVNKCLLRLISEDGKETRFYKLFFTVPSEVNRNAAVSIAMK